MSALDFLRRKRLERAIEDTLFAYPYLISPELKNPRRQEVLSKESRSDLAFYFTKLVVVVEIKRGTAGISALRQLERYLKEQRQRGFQAKGILIAHNFTSACLSTCKPLHKTLSCKRLNHDIPTQIIICKSCRQARDHRVVLCPNDGQSDILKVF